MPTRTRGSWFLPLMGLLCVLAWITLWAWEQSPYGRYLVHGQWDSIGTMGHHGHDLTGGAPLVPALVYLGGWVLMSAAMMLPTTLPLLEIFRRLTAPRSDRATLLGLVIGGYLTAWAAFGLVAHALDMALHRMVLGGAGLPDGRLIGAAVLGGAGLYQFTSLKRRCLERCRSPLGFVVGHWRGTRPHRRAFALGLHHGVYCVGCCWALMLLMFVIGTGSVGWMLLLGAVMAAEKNLTFGRRLSTPLGLGLIGWAALIILDHGRLLV